MEFINRRGKFAKNRPPDPPAREFPPLSQGRAQMISTEPVIGLTPQSLGIMDIVYEQIKKDEAPNHAEAILKKLAIYSDVYPVTCNGTDAAVVTGIEYSCGLTAEESTYLQELLTQDRA